METHSSSIVRLNRSLILPILGASTILGALIYYQAVLSRFLVESTGRRGILEDNAYATLIIILVALALTIFGVTRLAQGTRLDDVKRNSSTIMNILPTVLRDKRYSRIFILSALAYGIFFGGLSGTFVYQPGVTFSEMYLVRVPSALPVVCCGPFGQMPQLVVYLTQDFAVVLVPVNLVLVFTVSWLVGLNAAIASFTYQNRPGRAGRQWFSGLGAIVGLFTACPTCAGFFFLTTIGLTGAVSAALTLASLQALFIAIGIPLLVLTPLLTSRRMKIGSGDGCSITQDDR